MGSGLLAAPSFYTRCFPFASALFGLAKRLKPWYTFPMPWVKIDYSDGRFRVNPLTEEEAKEFSGYGYTVVMIDDITWDGYLAHLNIDAQWQNRWRKIDNKYQYPDEG